MSTTTVAAVDLGATSGRVILGRVGPDGLTMKHLARFPNEPVRIADGLHWNILELYRQVLAGLTAARREADGRIDTIGIDSWAVDYGLLRAGRLIGTPYHYRDPRTARGVAAVHARVDPASLYARNGLQHLPFNTVFQLASEDGLLNVVDRMLLIPDLLGFWLTGTEAAERTNASTTGLLDARTREWDRDLAAMLGIPAEILPPLIDPGTRLGPLRPEVAEQVGARLEVVATGTHDTASAVVAIPSTGREFAFISCGTWALAGLELAEPVLREEAREHGFTNEGGVDGRVRFLHNVTGLWLLSESLRTWDREATSEQQSSRLQQLLAEAARVTGPVPVFDVDDERFLPPGDMPARIAGWYEEHGKRPPPTQPELVRCIVESLAEAFARAVRDAARIADHKISAIHIVGGGAQNALLCQATADRSGLPVLAGPVEATAVGNILVQARANGALVGGLETLRALVARAFPPVHYEPRGI